MAGFMYNRTKKCFRLLSKKLRQTEPLETYATKECCNPILVLAHTTDTTSWKNDITSAWVKLPELTDSVTFELFKDNDTLSTYVPSKNHIVKEETGYYVTIPWRDVLALDGIGCYYLKITTIINGTTESSIWGKYNLQSYTTENAQNTIRVKVDVNQYYSIDDIDFTGTHLIDTLRFGGFFGNMSPNFKIDNLIYENRRFENVQRERIATYTMTSDPIDYKYTGLLLDFYLLAENSIWLSDHNEFNHSLFYKDTELVVNDTPSVDYKEFSNLATVTCTFTDKVRNNLAKYNG